MLAKLTRLMLHPSELAKRQGSEIPPGWHFAVGVTTGAGPVLLSAADGTWELGELAGSAANPGRVDAHHIRTSNNTCRRNTRSRLVIVG